MTANTPFDAMFSGVIGQNYDLLKLICPLSIEMSRLVGETVAQYSQLHARTISVLELGGGTGITTLAMLSGCESITILSVDNEPTMQTQAKQGLQTWVQQGRLQFSGDDALTALQALASDSIDLVASAYTLHNFEHRYRKQVISEIFRVLKAGGQSINADRYGLDDIAQHTLTVQQEIAGYFKVLVQLGRLDVLEYWIIHLFNDESENHVMRAAVALNELAEAGFGEIQLSHRREVNALVTACKPQF
jgi:ubiquinone/menaquinone biosynthesis C-methylase UbiE